MSSRSRIVQKTGSVAFFLSIPVLFAGGIAALQETLHFLSLDEPDRRSFALFCYGAVAAFSFISTSRASRWEVLVHELKHYAAVVLTGSRVTDFYTAEGHGHVEFVLRPGAMRFYPFIALAPYAFPLFSLPLLLTALVLDSRPTIIFPLLLGFFLVADLMTGWKEVHAHQTDFESVRGGWLTALAFVIGFQFFWAALCLLWMTGGKRGVLSLVLSPLSIAELFY